MNYNSTLENEETYFISVKNKILTSIKLRKYNHDFIGHIKAVFFDEKAFMNNNNKCHIFWLGSAMER